jgi:hypothetical protein
MGNHPGLFFCLRSRRDFLIKTYGHAPRMNLRGRPEVFSWHRGSRAAAIYNEGISGE